MDNSAKWITSGEHSDQKFVENFYAEVGCLPAELQYRVAYTIMPGGEAAFDNARYNSYRFTRDPAQTRLLVRSVTLAPEIDSERRYIVAGNTARHLELAFLAMVEEMEPLPLSPDEKDRLKILQAEALSRFDCN